MYYAKKKAKLSAESEKLQDLRNAASASIHKKYAANVDFRISQKFQVHNHAKVEYSQISTSHSRKILASKLR